jgi:hypothetical protein
VTRVIHDTLATIFAGLGIALIVIIAVRFPDMREARKMSVWHPEGWMPVWKKIWLWFQR